MGNRGRRHERPAGLLLSWQRRLLAPMRDEGRIVTGGHLGRVRDGDCSIIDVRPPLRRGHCSRRNLQQTWEGSSAGRE
jgi:hypothetical protein